ncbi:MAG: hypothetical protein JWM46_697 [Candidatus Kaiserbacteria bacterium]|nr:hypothetical protein [Candidatus Kaiserbacteria bacterium]
MTMGPDNEDRGVEGEKEEIVVDGEHIEIQMPPALDGLGNPAAPEDDMGHDS